MATISGLDVKREIVGVKLKPDEAIAMLSGFVRSCMSLEVTGKNGIMLVLDCQTDFVREFISSNMLKYCKVAPKNKEGALTYSDCEKLLRMLEITSADGGIFEIMGIPQKYTRYASAYVRGMFLGSGSFSVHEAEDDGAKNEKTSGGGYHLEFSVLSESLADELVSLLEQNGIAVRKMVRAEKYVVYAKDNVNVGDCLTLMRADKTMFRLADTVVKLSFKRDINRRVNCEVANIARTTDAATEVSDAIEYIANTVGLDTLHPKLLEAADARLNSPEASLSELAYELGISKSGLKHRYDKIIATANALKAKRK